MFKKILLASALLVGSTIASNATVLFSDNFNLAPQGLGTATNDATPPGWILDYGSVDVIGTNFYEFYPGNGNYLDMNGSTSQSGGIYTNASFNFLAGKTYTISFDYGNNNYSAGGSSEGLTASAGAYSVSVTSIANIANLLAVTFSFTPTTSFTSALFFSGFEDNPGDNGGIILDNVSLSVVPVPAALPLLAAGLGVLGVVGRRRKAKAAA